MKRIFGTIVFLALAAAAGAAGPSPDSVEAYLESRGAPSAHALFASGRVVLVDDGSGELRIGAWDVPGIPRPGDGELPSDVEVTAFKATKAAAKAQAEQDAKPLSRKLLENEWFDLADEIALAAGDPPMPEADARDLSKLRAKLKKAKGAKDAAAGAGKKAKADDLLEINELRGRLLLIDAELSAEDPGWKKNAKRHSVP